MANPDAPEMSTVQDVKSRVAKIRKLRDDSEMAHAAEDALYEELLAAIASGIAEEPAAMARVALETSTIDFERWCACPPPPGLPRKPRAMTGLRPCGRCTPICPNASRSSPRRFSRSAT